MKTKRYLNLDLIRTVSLIAVLLYHLNLLQGGYLAVCTFFVLSGYLSVLSGFKNEKFSLLKYYKNKFIKIYLPLLIVVCLTVLILSFMPNIEWFNLRPETNSVLLGYNNYWQLNANLDYFVRLISSPFMHFWYIALLLQFELIFPIVFLILKKIGEKISKFIPCLLLFIAGTASFIFFYLTVKNGNLMTAYYGTFERSFSLLFGMMIGFIHVYYKPLELKKKSMNLSIFNILLIGLMTLFILIDFKSSFFAFSMLLSTLLTVLLINFGTNNHKNVVVNGLSSAISKISYEVYLVQYPVIFIFQNIDMNDFIKIPLIIIITLIISIIINYALDIKKKSKTFFVKIILCLIILIGTGFGFYKYIQTEDHTEEMKKLEDDLNKNQELIEQKRKEYLESLKNEEEDWEKVLSELDGSEEKIKDIVTNLRVVGVGDSIMELAVKDLYKVFPNGYFDAATNRTEKAAKEILKDLKNKGLLGDIIILNIGTNGSCYGECKEEVMEILGPDRTVYWLNATHPDFSAFNPSLIDLASKHENLHIIDWIKVMEENPGYLISDKVHPTVKGCKLYAQTIYDAVYKDYLANFDKMKEQKIKEHEEKLKQKITFIGNDLLIKGYDTISSEYPTSNLITDDEIDYNKLENIINNNKIAYNLVLLFDKKVGLTDKEYDKLIELCKDHKLYIVDLNRKINIENENVVIIDFYNEIKNNDDYLSFDNVHLTDEGYKKLKEMIIEKVKKPE